MATWVSSLDNDLVTTITFSLRILKTENCYKLSRTTLSGTTVRCANMFSQDTKIFKRAAFLGTRWQHSCLLYAVDTGAESTPLAQQEAASDSNAL